MTQTHAPTSRPDCEALDRSDPLAASRAQFALPEGVIYLDGHSLGPATHAALDRVGKAAREEWANGLIRSWNDAGWFDLPSSTAAKLARLIGVPPGDVIVTDSVSVNLFKLAVAALKHLKKKWIMVEADEFPTDQSIAGGIEMAGLGNWMRLAPNGALHTFSQSQGVLIKSVVNYRTGAVADIAAWERAAEKAGSLIVWDLSHASGVLDLKLAEHGAKLAAGCTYKFLNGGPGAPAFVYARADLADELMSPILGWFGQKDQFDFEAIYEAKDGAARFATGTPGVLSLAALDAALDAFDGVSLSAVAAKARALGDLVIARTRAMGLELISPADAALRGGHVSVRHEHGYAVVQALIARGVIPDFRSPDAMRFGVSPLYLRFVDVWDAMDHLADILETRAWDRPAFHARAKVT